jgi:phosphoenolpyruvate-protein kinase (PTS system EI component)
MPPIWNARVQVLNAAGVPDLAYKIGTMIEVPRAALQAGNIASVASFFSFGTNDLTRECVCVFACVPMCPIP